MRGGQAAQSGFDAATVAIMPSERVTRLHLLRHGEVAGFRARVVGGQVDLPLSPHGREQNRRLARWFAAQGARPARLFTSDLQRCRALAGELGGALGLAPELEPALREQDMGAWQGRTWREITAGDGARVSAYWNDYARVAPTGGETFVELCARVEAWWEHTEARHGGSELAVVTHVGPIRALCCRLLGVPREQALRFAPAVASLTTLLVSDTGAVLEAFGERPWTFGAGAPAPLDPTRPARVALSGSAGTGKTTLGHALAERLGVPFLEEGMRRRIAGGLVLHDLSRAELRALVLELWREQRALEERAEGGFVADRSSLDYAAFWLHYGLSDGDRESTETFEELARAARTYDRILLLPWGVLPLVHDGVRSTDRFVQLRFQTIVEGLLRRYAGPRQVLALPAEAADLDERLAYVLGDLLPG